MAAPSQIAHYQITSKLGEGGMGAVYRAIDTKLHREVAIKVLPAAFAADSARMARFEREAQVLASLNHPNIAAIYGIEHGAIVMELVDGADLAGPVPIDTAIDYARQIAAGLEAAHEKGIVHRDLKPANIKVTRGGQIKILDFGLAKASEAAARPGDPSISPTLSLGMTEAGIILGTAAYMSPEQARGKPVDQRADIWAFGVVLYELVTGRRLFEGEDFTDTLAAVVKTDPDITAVPGPVRGVLQRCLQKDPNKRLRHISSVELLLEKPTAPVAPVTHKARTTAVSGLAALLFVIAAAGWLLYLRRPEPLKPELIRLEIPIPPDMHVIGVPRMSPDGRMVAFVAVAGGEGRPRIWIRRLDSLDLHPLARTEGATGHPLWFPDSRMLVYVSEGKARKIDVTGGPPQTICDSPSIGGGFVSGNRIVFGTLGEGIVACPAEGGQKESVLPVDPAGHEAFRGFPTPLPGGRRFLFFRQAGPQSGIYAGALDARPGEQTDVRVLPDSSAPWYIPGPNRHQGTLLFVRERTLMVQTLDPDRLELKGSPVVLGQNVPNEVNFSASEDGKLVYLADTQQRQLAWFDLEGKMLGNVGPPHDALNGAELSPDGTRLAFSREEPDRRSDIFVLDLARASETRVTSGPGSNELPVWSPDGAQIAFLSTREGGYSLYARAADGSGSDRLLLKNGDRKYPRAWSPDGRFLLFATQTSLWALPVVAPNSEPKLTQYAQAVGNSTGGARFSPDGHYVAYVSSGSGVPEVYLRPFAPASQDASSAGAASLKISLHGGFLPAWRADGKEIFYLTGGSPGKLKIWAVDVTLKPFFRASIPRPMGETPTGNHLFMPDGKRVLVEHQAGSRGPSLVVLLNWQAALPR